MTRRYLDVAVGMIALAAFSHGRLGAAPSCTD